MTITLNIEPEKERVLQEQAHHLGLVVEQYVMQVIDEGIAQHAHISSNEAARSLLNQWMTDETGYDEEAWPRAKKAIEENRLSSRSRFGD